jgi:hypothetical protein
MLRVALVRTCPDNKWSGQLSTLNFTPRHQGDSDSHSRTGGFMSTVGVTRTRSYSEQNFDIEK